MIRTAPGSSGNARALEDGGGPVACLSTMPNDSIAGESTQDGYRCCYHNRGELCGGLDGGVRSLRM